MRRWVPWATVAAVLVALGLALTQVPHVAPYAFLRNHDYIEMRLTPEEEAGLWPKERSVYYSLKTDYRALRKVADAELEALGYENDGFEGRLGDDFFAPDPARPGHWVPKVTFHKDTKAIRVTEPGPPIQVTALDGYVKGWVTVEVHNPREPTWFENFRAWIGI